MKAKLISKINRRVKHYEVRNEIITKEVDGIKGFDNLSRYQNLCNEFEMNKARIEIYWDILSDIEIFSGE